MDSDDRWIVFMVCLLVVALLGFGLIGFALVALKVLEVLG